MIRSSRSIIVISQNHAPCHCFTHYDDIQKPLVVLVVGASGDLAKKKTYPALLALWKANLLPRRTAIWGFARTTKTHDELRQHLKPHLVRSLLPDNNDGNASTSANEQTVDEFLAYCFYRAGSSYGDVDVVQSILKDATATNDSDAAATITPLDNLLVYLAIPPHVFSESTLAVKTALEQLPPVAGFTRIVLEKPFGQDTASCQELLDSLAQQQWSEDQLYRIDHFLGKEMVQNLLTLRQHNPWLRAVWNKDVVQSVHILCKEQQGTKGRGGYFDPIGMMRDLLQNHLLQILTLVAMNVPADGNDSKSLWTPNDIRNAKVDVLNHIPAIQLSDCLLGQYDGYKDDATIENRDTVTPTYAAVKVQVNTPEWQDVPFVLEAGKALDERLCEIRLHFKGSTNSQPNALVLRLQPNPAVYFCANLKTPGFSETPASTHLGVDYAGANNKIPDAYTRLLLDVLRGQQASFVRDDELLAAWKIFTPVLHQTERECIEPLPYSSGTSGPVVRDEYLQAMGIGQPWLSPPAAL